MRELRYMPIDASLVQLAGAKLESFVAMKYFSRGWRLRAMPVARSLLPRQYAGEVSK